MIILKDTDLIATSKTRHCYLHPDTSDKVIKIIVDPQDEKKRMDANMKEWCYYERLKKMSIDLNFIPTYYGFVPTNLGRGLMSECVRDYNGNVSVRLQEIVSHNVQYDLDEIKHKLDIFTQRLIKYNIQLFDLNRFNLLIQVTKAGTYNPISIDVKGPYNNNEFIPFSTYIPYLSRKKLIRRSKRLLNIITTAQQERTTLNLSKQ